MALTIAYWRERIRLINLSMARAVAAKNTKGEIRWLVLLADATTSLRTLLDPPEPEEEAEIAVAPAFEPVPTVTLTGLTNLGAAKVDAGFAMRAAQGDTSGEETNPVPGAALKLGFSGVIGVGTNPVVYGTFVGGTLTATSTDNPGAGPDGFSTPFGLADGIDPDAPYTG